MHLNHDLRTIPNSCKPTNITGTNLIQLDLTILRKDQEENQAAEDAGGEDIVPLDPATQRADQARFKREMDRCKKKYRTYRYDVFPCRVLPSYQLS